MRQVTALETRVLQLVADEEVASVTAGAGEQQAAAAALQAAQQALAAVDQVRHTYSMYEACSCVRTVWSRPNHFYSSTLPATSTTV